MAVKKNTESVDKVEQKSSAELENEKLKRELDELKAMMTQLIASQAKPVETKRESEDIFRSIEDELNISPHKLIRVVSMVVGGLSLKGASGKEPVHFRDFGTSKTVTFEDVRAFVDNHHELALGGGFIIQDKDVVKALYLEDEYKKLLSKEKVESLIDLPADEIVNILKSAPKTLQDTIVQYFVRMIPKDNRYTDWNKIKMVSDFVGEDLMELARQIEE
jgi:hypothetical protein